MCSITQVYNLSLMCTFTEINRHSNRDKVNEQPCLTQYVTHLDFKTQYIPAREDDNTAHIFSI
jgi:hypothetical protein